MPSAKELRIPVGLPGNEKADGSDSSAPREAAASSGRSWRSNADAARRMRKPITTSRAPAAARSSISAAARAASARPEQRQVAASAGGLLKTACMSDV